MRFNQFQYFFIIILFNTENLINLPILFIFSRLNGFK